MSLMQTISSLSFFPLLSKLLRVGIQMNISYQNSYSSRNVCHLQMLTGRGETKLNDFLALSRSFCYLPVCNAHSLSRATHTQAVHNLGIKSKIVKHFSRCSLHFFKKNFNARSIYTSYCLLPGIKIPHS